MTRVLEFRRALPGAVPALEREGYHVIGGHGFSVDEVSLLLVREPACDVLIGDDRSAGEEAGGGED